MSLLTRLCVHCGEEENYSPFYDFEDERHTNCEFSREEIRNHKSQWQINQEAIEKTLSDYFSEYGAKNLEDLMRGRSHFAKPLVFNGYRCVQCGGRAITDAIIRFYNYGNMAKCHDCQK